MFDRIADVYFFNENEKEIGYLKVNQSFQGKLEKNIIKFDTIIEGNLQKLSANQQVFYNSFHSDYIVRSHVRRDESDSIVRNRLVESKVTVKYTVVNTNDPADQQKFKIVTRDRISYKDCEGRADSHMGKVSVQTKTLIVSKQSESLSINSENSLYLLNEAPADPCASNPCDTFHECITDPEHEGGFKCMCRDGFQEEPECYDINECEEQSPCSQHAECTNNLGGYECVCKDPYLGDGKKCEALEYDYSLICRECGENAECARDEDEHYFCKCKEGFEGDGYICQKSAVFTNKILK